MSFISTFFKRLFFALPSLLCVNLWAAPTADHDNFKYHNIDDHTLFDDSLYVTKICRESYPKTLLGERYDDVDCEEGYVLKVEQLGSGEVYEKIIMDDIPSTLWYRTTLNKLDNNTYLMHLSCGNYCGGNTLIGRGSQMQDFSDWFTYDVDSRCTAEFDHDKMLWVARSFFSDKIMDLPKTFGKSDTAAGLKYTAQFNSNGQLAISEYMAKRPKFILPNPCEAVR